MSSLHKLLREDDGWPETICGREGKIVIEDGRRYMKTYHTGTYELAPRGAAPTCRHCLLRAHQHFGPLAECGTGGTR